MPASTMNLLIMIVIYVIIIILIPILLDYLFRIFIRSKRRYVTKEAAQTKAKSSSKPLIVIQDQNGLIISETANLDTDTKYIPCNLNECLEAMKENSMVIIVNETLEYVPDLNRLLTNLKSVAGSDLYVLGLEKNSPRVFYDYKIVNILDKPVYFPGSNLTWSEPNKLQKSVQSFYSYIFKILPYDFFSTDLLVKK